MEIKNIEDCLEVLIGLVDIPNQTFHVESSDYTILSSIGRQVFRGVALTDRQYDVVKTKLSETYVKQFNMFPNFFSVLDVLRMPLRTIDRSHWVKLSSYKEQETIAVRFPFSKRYISLMEKLGISSRKEYYHDKGSHIHHFKLSEMMIYEIITELKDKKQFIIDPELLELYKKIAVIIASPEQHIPGVYNVELKNLPLRTINYIVSDIGHPEDTPLFKFKDRSLVYGLHHFDEQDLHDSLSGLSTLTQRIIRRKHNIVFVDKNKWSLNAVSAALLELDRFPLLIVLNNKDEYEDDLVRTQAEFKGFIQPSETSVMFRIDNNENTNHPFNNYIKTNLINNKVANHTKVVYINSSKVPKPVLQSAWRPRTSLYMGSQRSSRIDSYAAEMDLVIHYDTEVTPMAKGFNVNIEKL